MKKLPRYTPYFGGCPVCWQQQGVLNVGRAHLACCHTHKKYWYVGSNVFSAWREETEADWEKNKATLETYEECEPAECHEPRAGGYINEVAMLVPGVSERHAEDMTAYAIRKAMSEKPQLARDETDFSAGWSDDDVL
jgi:hypothetical protein